MSSRASKLIQEVSGKNKDEFFKALRALYKEAGRTTHLDPKSNPSVQQFLKTKNMNMPKILKAFETVNRILDVISKETTDFDKKL